MGQENSSTTTTTTKKVIFYGSLKRGFFNFDRFRNYGKQVYVRDIELPGYDIYNLRFYPAVCEGKGTIKAEIHDLEEEVYKCIYVMEMGAGYVEKMIEIEGESYSLFVMPKSLIEKCCGILIESGEWENKIHGEM